MDAAATRNKLLLKDNSSVSYNIIDSRDLHGVDCDGGVVVDAVLFGKLLPEVVRQLQTQLTPVGSKTRKLS